MVNADLRSAEVIKRTIDVAYPAVAEIGVYRGDMSQRLLIHPTLMLFMVDPWGEYIADTYKATGDEYSMHSQEEWEAVKVNALNSVTWAKDRVNVFQGTSDAAAEYYDEKGYTFDIVFIDGDHSYEQTKQDIISWWGLVNDGGYIGGHDYRNDKNYGVIQAVDEFVTDMDLRLELGENYTWFVKKWES